MTSKLPSSPQASQFNPFERQYSLQAPPVGTDFASLCHDDPAMQLAIGRARRMLGRDIPIILQGESGVGKEMFAKAFHNESPRRDLPFVALNCAAIPENLIEAELFGYVGGAFTGARREGCMGKIQKANGGTLFLDEIGDMPLNLQARLLRVLQERIVTPLGSNREIPVDVALICATHRRLRDEVQQGRFREDLYYRLNGLAITLPALRERQDIACLLHKMTAHEARRLSRRMPVAITDNAMAVLVAYPWPGNLRQLTNVIRVAIAMLEDDEHCIDEQHLPEEVFDTFLSENVLPFPLSKRHPPEATAIGNSSLRKIGQLAAEKALAASAGNVSAAARLLGVSRNTLYRKLGRL